MSSDDFNKPYEPKNVEPEIYKRWEESGYFNPDNLPNRNGKTFTIALPPPNVTGSLHMGHALQDTIQDILIRKKRMEGFKTLWLPGTDHASIGTHAVIEKELKKEGLNRFKIGREKFLERAWAWKEKYGGIIIEQMRKLGSSADWSRTRFTMDPQYIKAVETAFLYYQKKGLVYQGERVVNWCPSCHTSISDLELEYIETAGKLWYIKYPIKDSKEFVIVATTRPETMLGDMAVAVNPKDERYKTLAGKTVILPIQNREIPIVQDRRIEMEFGTGAVKVTPNHDAADEAIAIDNKLGFMQVIDENGRMTEKAGEEFKGLKTTQAREKVLEELGKLGLIEKIEELTHNVSVCSRCGSVIEPLRSKQWFLKMEELAKIAIEDVKSGKVKFHPERWEKIYFDWLENIRDWCISRQLWWGQKIPIEGVDDVFDTWFSSALWPFAALGWPEKTKDLETYYPTQVLTTARDIINLWVARMVYSSEEFLGTPPFSDVIVHGTILAKTGQRMSKSLGTGVDPMTLIEKYGADATRFGLIWQAMGGQDIKWSDEHVVAGKKFSNKIWNASRFVLEQIKNFELQEINVEQIPIVQKFDETAKKVDALIENYDFGQALHELYEFFWHEFCDKYLEEAKKDNSEETKTALLFVLTNSLKLLHPFMPHITERIWEEMPQKNKKLLIIEEWPQR